MNSNQTDLEECISQIGLYTLVTSDKVKLKEKELIYLLMDLTTMGISIIIVHRHLMVNLFPKLYTTKEVSKIILLMETVLNKARTTYSKVLSAKELDLLALLPGIITA